MTAPSQPLVTRAEAIAFCEEAFRHIEIGPLSEDDLNDIALALTAFRDRQPSGSEVAS